MDAILNRRSIRAYTAEPVSDDLVAKLLAAAMAAPSANNQQPWHFVVIRDRGTLDAVPDIHPHSRMVRQAPLAILVCGDPAAEKNPGYWVQDCAAATENLLIAATALGLGSVWLGVYPREDRVTGLRRLLGVPEPIVPFALVPIGRAGEVKPPADRYQESRVHRDRW
jgi:nitroreductase